METSWDWLAESGSLEVAESGETLISNKVGYKGGSETAIELWRNNEWII